MPHEALSCRGRVDPRESNQVRCVLPNNGSDDRVAEIDHPFKKRAVGDFVSIALLFARWLGYESITVVPDSKSISFWVVAG